MLHRRFRKLRILQRAPDLTQVYAEPDFLLHGSGPSLLSEANLLHWPKLGPAPYGALRITLTKPRG